MRIADRYIGWQILFGVIFGVSLLTIIFVLSQVLREVRPYLLEYDAPLPLLFKVVVCIVPFSLMFTLPWGFLSSILLSFGRLSSNNELIGLRMAGISLTRVALPALVLGLIFSGVSHWIAGTIAPQSAAALRALPYEAISKDPKSFLTPGIVQAKFPGQKVYIEDRDDETLRGFHLYQLSDTSRDTYPTSYVHAGEVGLKVDMEKKIFILTLSDFQIETFKEDGTIEIATAAEAEPWYIDWSNSTTRRARTSELTNAAISARLREPDTTAKEVKELQVTLHQRHSISLACLAFALIGVPLGINGRRKETSAGLVLSFLVAGAYFSGMLFTDPLRDSSLPVIVTLIWLPNIAAVILGIWLFRRASQR